MARRVEMCLDLHDQQDPSVQHKAMILTQTVAGLNSAVLFYLAYSIVAPGKCGLYVTTREQQIAIDADEEFKKFERGEVRSLVIIGKLREGFDDKRISVVAIARNVAPSSRVLFAQFVGRAVRKAHGNDPVTAMVVSHPKYNQEYNFLQFDQIAEQENNDDEWEFSPEDIS